VDKPARETPRSFRSARPYLLLLPAFLCLAAFTYWPMLQVLLASLTDKKRVGDSGAFVGAENYFRIFQDAHFLGALGNNALYAAGTVIPSVLFGFLFALALRETTNLSAVLRSILFFPTLVPLVGAAAVFIFVFMPDIGLLDYYLAKLGISATNWLGNPDLALVSLMALTTWKNAGYYMLFFLAGLQGVPQDAEEAAKIEGANWLQRLYFVIIPMLGPTFAFVLVIALISAVSQIDHVIVMTDGGPNNSTNLLLYYIYQQAHEFYDLGKATAATVITLIALLTLSFLSMRTVERKVHYET
jgi:sn-glycerol 3-phosphate transport system permease protein